MLKGRGFSLIEVLTVVAIVLILATVTVPLFGNLVGATNADQSAELIAQALRLARERSRAGLDNSTHGVKFLIQPDQPIRYVVFRGTDYASRQTQFDFSQALPKAASLNFLNGDDETVFSSGRGLPDGGLDLEIIFGPGVSSQVEVTSLGLVLVK